MIVNADIDYLKVYKSNYGYIDILNNDQYYNNNNENGGDSCIIKRNEYEKDKDVFVLNSISLMGNCIINPYLNNYFFFNNFNNLDYNEDERFYIRLKDETYIQSSDNKNNYLLPKIPSKMSTYIFSTLILDENLFTSRYKNDISILKDSENFKNHIDNDASKESIYKCEYIDSNERNIFIEKATRVFNVKKVNSFSVKNEFKLKKINENDDTIKLCLSWKREKSENVIFLNESSLYIDGIKSLFEFEKMEDDNTIFKIIEYPPDEDDIIKSEISLFIDKNKISTKYIQNIFLLLTDKDNFNQLIVNCENNLTLNEIKPFISYDKMILTKDDIKINCRFDVSILGEFLSKNSIKNLYNEKSYNLNSDIKFSSYYLNFSNGNSNKLLISNISDENTYIISKKYLEFDNENYYSIINTDITDNLIGQSIILKPKEEIEIIITDKNNERPISIFKNLEFNFSLFNNNEISNIFMKAIILIKFNKTFISDINSKVNYNSNNVLDFTNYSEVNSLFQINQNIWKQNLSIQENNFKQINFNSNDSLTSESNCNILCYGLLINSIKIPKDSNFVFSFTNVNGEIRKLNDDSNDIYIDGVEDDLINKILILPSKIFHLFKNNNFTVKDYLVTTDINVGLYEYANNEITEEFIVDFKPIIFYYNYNYEKKDIIILNNNFLLNINDYDVYQDNNIKIEDVISTISDDINNKEEIFKLNFLKTLNDKNIIEEETTEVILESKGSALNNVYLTYSDINANLTYIIDNNGEKIYNELENVDINLTIETTLSNSSNIDISNYKYELKLIGVYSNNSENIKNESEYIQIYLDKSEYSLSLNKTKDIINLLIDFNNDKLKEDSFTNTIERIVFKLNEYDKTQNNLLTSEMEFTMNVNIEKVVLDSDSSSKKIIECVLNPISNRIDKREVLFALLNKKYYGLEANKKNTFTDEEIENYFNSTNQELKNDNDEILSIVKSIKEINITDMNDIEYLESGVDFSYIDQFENSDQFEKYCLGVFARTTYKNTKEYFAVVIDNYDHINNNLINTINTKLSRLNGSIFYLVNLENKHNDYEYKILVDGIERNEGEIIQNDTIEISEHTFKLYARIKGSHDIWNLYDEFVGCIDNTKPHVPKFIDYSNNQYFSKYQYFNSKDDLKNLLNDNKNFINELALFNYKDEILNLNKEIDYEILEINDIIDEKYKDYKISIKGSEINDKNELLLNVSSIKTDVILIENRNTYEVYVEFIPNKKKEFIEIYTDNILSSNLTDDFRNDYASSSGFKFIINGNSKLLFNVKLKQDIEYEEEINIRIRFQKINDGNGLSFFTTENVKLTCKPIKIKEYDILKELLPYRFYEKTEDENNLSIENAEYFVDDINNIFDINNFNREYFYKFEIFLDSIKIYNSNIKMDGLLIDDSKLDEMLYNGFHDITLITSKFNGLENYKNYHIILNETKFKNNNLSTSYYSDRHMILPRNENLNDISFENELIVDGLGNISLVRKNDNNDFYLYRVTEKILHSLSFTKFIINNEYELYEKIKQSYSKYYSFIKEKYDELMNMEKVISNNKTDAVVINNIRNEIQLTLDFIDKTIEKYNTFIQEDDSKISKYEPTFNEVTPYSEIDGVQWFDSEIRIPFFKNGNNKHISSNKFNFINYENNNEHYLKKCKILSKNMIYQNNPDEIIIGKVNSNNFSVYLGENIKDAAIDNTTTTLDLINKSGEIIEIYDSTNGELNIIKIIEILYGANRLNKQINEFAIYVRIEHYDGSKYLFGIPLIFENLMVSIEEFIEKYDNKKFILFKEHNYNKNGFSLNPYNENEKFIFENKTSATIKIVYCRFNDVIEGIECRPFYPNDLTISNNDSKIINIYPNNKNGFSFTNNKDTMVQTEFVCSYFAAYFENKFYKDSYLEIVSNKYNQSERLLKIFVDGQNDNNDYQSMHINLTFMPFYGLMASSLIQKINDKNDYNLNLPILETDENSYILLNDTDDYLFGEIFNPATYNKDDKILYNFKEKNQFNINEFEYENIKNNLSDNVYYDLYYYNYYHNIDKYDSYEISKNFADYMIAKVFNSENIPNNYIYELGIFIIPPNTSLVFKPKYYISFSLCKYSTNTEYKKEDFVKNFAIDKFVYTLKNISSTTYNGKIYDHPGPYNDFRLPINEDYLIGYFNLTPNTFSFTSESFRDHFSEGKIENNIIDQLGKYYEKKDLHELCFDTIIYSNKLKNNKLHLLNENLIFPNYEKIDLLIKETNEDIYKNNNPYSLIDSNLDSLNNVLKTKASVKDYKKYISDNTTNIVELLYDLNELLTDSYAYSNKGWDISINKNYSSVKTKIFNGFKIPLNNYEIIKDVGFNNLLTNTSYVLNRDGFEYFFNFNKDSNKGNFYMELRNYNIECLNFINNNIKTMDLSNDMITNLKYSKEMFII